MKLITLQNLSTFADEIKARYAKAADLTAVSDRVKALEDAGAQANVLEAVKVNGTAQAITEKAVDITVPTKASELTNDAKYQTEEQVVAAITAKVSSTYKAGGSVAFASLPTADEAHLGMVYNVTDKFTATADFVEGAGGKHPAGTNVVVVKSGDEYKYDVLAGFVDLSEYAKTADVVAKEEGKGLSTNDYTNDDKAKLGGVAEGATKVEASETNGNIKVNGSETPVYVLPDTVLHQSDFEPVTEAEILALFEETVAE